MGSDRARISYDRTRKWRGLVAQQGRVTVEADWNEAAAIDAAHDRHVTLDVVGPVGSPDGGYLVTPGQPDSPPSASPPASIADLTVGKGTLYLGGERLDLWADVDVDAQPDWLDPATGTFWLAPEPPQQSPPAATNELLYLLAIEQEVSAREDPALADVALGGPDTMQRLRLLQRFVRWPTQSTSCTQAWSEVTTAWGDIGLSLDSSMQLKSSARLQVGFVTGSAPPSPCQPVATGGYLGAENQLVRVQIASVDPTGVPTIVWGFDDATFLYKLGLTTPDNSGNVILTLLNAPVDSFHNPIVGQTVELLRDAASLTPDDPNSSTDDGYIAAAAGPIYTVSQSYNTSAGTVAISGDLPASYQGANQLFLRVWQSSMPAPAGTAVTLSGAGANTGVTVTLSSDDGVFHPGDFWCFALRPSVPSLIYPARYGDAPQPPEGARVLACPIAMVTQQANGAPTVSSCIPPFDNLVELTGRGSGCCTLRVTPDALASTSLNTLLTPYVGQGPIKVCFGPGTYTLTEPLIVDTSFADITLEGCGGPVTLQAPANPGSQFLLGLIVIEGTSGVTLRGIDLVTPLIPFTPGDSFTVLTNAVGLGSQILLEQFAVDLKVAVGISAQGTTGLVVEDCRFGHDFTALKVAANIFAAGILASGSLSEIAVTDCVFAVDPIPSVVPYYDMANSDPTTDDRPSPPYRLTFGYLQVPAVAITPRGDERSELVASVGVLQDGAIEGCRFLGLTVPALVLDQLGTIRLENNTVQDCYAGFWLFSVANATDATVFELVPTGGADTSSELAAMGLSVLATGVVLLSLAMARVLPTKPPTDAQVTGRVVAPLDQATLSVAAQGLRSLFSQAVTALAPTARQANAAGAGTPAATGLLGSLVADVHKMFTRQQPNVAPPAQSSTPAAAAGLTVPAQTAGQGAAAVAADSTPATKADLVSMLLPALNNVVTDVGAQATQVPVASDTGTTPTLRLTLSGNQIDAMVTDSYSGPGLLVMDITGTTGSILLNGNRVANRYPNGQGAVVYTMQNAAALNGNIIANEAAGAGLVISPLVVKTPDTAAPTNTTCSLFFLETQAADNLPVAIVGNVFVAAPILLPSQLQQTWLTLNAVTT
jgi:hypothetical protein